MSFAVLYIAQKYYTKRYKCPQPTTCYPILEGRGSHLILHRSNILLQPKNFPQCDGERCFCWFVVFILSQTLLILIFLIA